MAAAVRLAEDPGVDAERHHAPALAVQAFGGIGDEFRIAPRIHLAHGEQLRVVPFRVGRDRDDGRLGAHGHRALVVRPVDDMVEARLRQQARGARAFAVVLPDPAARPAPEAGFEPRGRLGDEGALLRLVHALGDHPVGDRAVRGDAVAIPDCALDDLGALLGGGGAERDGGPQPVRLQYVEEAPDADAQPVEAAGEIVVVRAVAAERACKARVAERIRVRIELEMLDMDERHHREPGAARPDGRGLRRRPVEPGVVIAGAVSVAARLLAHGPASGRAQEGSHSRSAQSAISEPVACHTPSWLIT